MRDNRKSEVHSGDARHRLPRVTAVVAAVDASVVLEVEAIRIIGIACDLVHALAELRRRCVGHERHDDAAVARRPGRAAIVAAVHARCRDGNEEPFRIRRVDEDRVQAHASPARHPLGPMRMIPQAAHQREGTAAVVAAEQRGRLDAGVEDLGLIRGTRRQLPDPSQRRTGVVGERQRGVILLSPRGAEIIRAP